MEYEANDRHQDINLVKLTNWFGAWVVRLGYRVR